jgi:cell division protein FtsB
MRVSTFAGIDQRQDGCFSSGMIVMREIRKRARALTGPVLGLMLTGYFGYHLVEGDRGLRAWMHLSQELRQAKEQLAAVSARRTELQHRVAHMRADHVDPDLLESQIRKTLDVLRPDEIVIPVPTDGR